MNFPDHRGIGSSPRKLSSLCLGGLLASALIPVLHAADYFWDADGDGSAAIGGTGSWDTTAALWRLGSSTGPLNPWGNPGENNDALLQGTAGMLTLSTGISVNDLFVAPTAAGAYTVTGTSQTLTLNGAIKSVIDVATGSTLTLNLGLAGTNGFTKSGAGTLVLDGANGTGSLFGGINVTGGTLQAGTGGNSGSTVLRSNAVNLASGTSLTTLGTGGTADFRVGSLSGSGSVIPGSGGTLNVMALTDATFSGLITTTGGFTLRAGHGVTQTINGDLSGITGTITINNAATLKLTGAGATSGVLGTSAGANAMTMNLRNGSLILDNTAGNTASANGRLPDKFNPAFFGGTLALIGNATDGSNETIGSFTMSSSAATISVTHNGGASGTVLNFTDAGTLRDSTAGTVNFVGLGGTLGTAGANPRITFTGTGIFTNTTNGALANTSSATNTTFGWATANSNSWAGVGANGIVALADTARDSATLASAAAWELTNFTPSTTTTTLSANLGAVSTPMLLKISPTASGQSLGAGTNSINTTAVMLTGTNDFSIIGTTGSLFGTVAGTRYVHVMDPAATLNVALSFSGAGQPFNKSGLGTLNLNGATNQINFTAVQNVNVLQGVLRGSLTTLGGGTSAGGTFTNLNLYGGVLEISGGGTLIRALGSSTTVGTASGGTIKWEGGTTARSDGGFSAIGGDATVTLVTTVGGATPASLAWNAAGFLQNGHSLIMGSTKSDSRLDFTNSLSLDEGSGTAYFAREVRVIDNPSSATDATRLSGIIAGGGNFDLLKTGEGVLELTNANTYAGNTLIKSGTLALIASGSLADTSSLHLMTSTSKFSIAAITGASETIATISGVAGSSVDLGLKNVTMSSNADATFSGNVIGSGGSITKQGTGTWTANGNNTYSGSTNIAGGTLLMGSPTALPVGAKLALSGGILKTGGYDAVSDTLNVSANSVIDFTSDTSSLTFADSSSPSWTGLLQVWNWGGGVFAHSSGSEFILFPNVTSLSNAQLTAIQFYSDNGITPIGVGAGFLAGTGELVPVPEPGALLTSLLLLGIIGFRERRAAVA